MKVNGKDKLLETSISVKDYLDAENYNADHIAIELDGEIISKENYSSTMLTDNSVMEIVQFMGGG
ncbi:MAG: sulfur carrier protein ThiS [Clostridia bacterium]|nr:sulfur carrier protein ThiS [Clostridia bacterium]